ncbi:MAG: helix-turn-helix transcriptional regulator [Lachnospiraceae bacterium]|nr:helix-turn-helix transcriptional regulator [Lachnospiraceae bacterium]
MTINTLLKEKEMTKYALSKKTGLSKSTVSDICNGKIPLKKCTGETLYKIAQALNVTVDALLDPVMKERIPFELFKSNVCHRLKREGDIDFLINTITDNVVLKYYELEWYPECFYMLAMIDYLSKLNDVPLIKEYDLVRQHQLENPLFPTDIYLTSIMIADDRERESFLNKAYQSSIPDFLEYNIVEKDVRDVV